jgi:hypothetical protein
MVFIKSITPEQFVFLYEKQILERVGELEESNYHITSKFYKAIRHVVMSKIPPDERQNAIISYDGSGWVLDFIDDIYEYYTMNKRHLIDEVETLWKL